MSILENLLQNFLKNYHFLRLDTLKSAFLCHLCNRQKLVHELFAFFRKIYFFLAPVCVVFLSYNEAAFFKSIDKACYCSFILIGAVSKLLLELTILAEKKVCHDGPVLSTYIKTSADKHTLQHVAHGPCCPDEHGANRLSRITIPRLHDKSDTTY